MLGHVVQSAPRSPVLLSYRFLRSRWERGYLKDLYHRRQLLGADPILHRSAYPNWNYSSEVFAFGHRIGAADVPVENLVKALTTESFYGRKDVDHDADRAAPSNNEEYNVDSNEQLTVEGEKRITLVLKRYLRSQLPEAPEELIETVATQLTDDELISNIARHLGIDVLVRTGEHPPSNTTIANAFKALGASVSQERLHNIVLDFIVPQLLDVDFCDSYSLNKPLDVLKDLWKQKGAQEIEPRLLRSMGECSAQPVYVVGIFKDKQEIIGESAGESVSIAVDMASREGLLRLWGLTSSRVFFFGDKALPSVQNDDFVKENYRLADVCSKETDLSVQETVDEEPINIVEVAMRYRNEVEATVGRSYTKRLRHKFSRGSLAKRSFRYLVKPKVYTVA